MAVPGREGLPPAGEMRAAYLAGAKDGESGASRDAAHESYLGKTRAESALSLAYNNGYSAGQQIGLQAEYGDPPK